MPIISEIGKRSIKVRILYGTIFAVLIAGSVTMIYPLLLMLAGSVKSEADSWSISPYPEFWFDNKILFQKYAESRYNSETEKAKIAWCTQVLSWRSIEPPEPVEEGYIRDFREFRAAIPDDKRVVGQMASWGMLPKNLRLFRIYMAKKYKNSLGAYNLAAGKFCWSWSNLTPPAEEIGRYRNRQVPDEFRQEMIKWRKTLPDSEVLVYSEHGRYAMFFLAGLYTSRIEAYNEAHGTSYKSYREIPFPDRVPAEPGLQREDWIKFVYNEIGLGAISLDPALEPAFRSFLSERYPSVDIFNKENGLKMASMKDIPFPEKLDDAPYLQRDFESFIRSPKFCPPESIRICGYDQMFREFLEKKRGGVPKDCPCLGAIVAATEWADCIEEKSAVRWEFTMRNYWQVLDYILMHGNGLFNTFIYCTLAVLTALIVNPLAAYALSRFKLPGTYKILLFCMATMAFPGEVTMIPGFLLLKRFPLWPIRMNSANYALLLNSYLKKNAKSFVFSVQN